MAYISSFFFKIDFALFLLLVDHCKTVQIFPLKIENFWILFFFVFFVSFLDISPQ